MKQAEDIELSSSEGEALIERIEGECWTAEDRHLVVQIIRLYVGVILALQEAKITVKRLRHLLFGKSPKPCPAPEDADAPSQPDGDSQETSASDPVEPDAHETPASAPESEPTEVEPATPSKPKGGHRPGTGRLGAHVDEGPSGSSAAMTTSPPASVVPAVVRVTCISCRLSRRFASTATLCSVPCAMTASGFAVPPAARSSRRRCRQRRVRRHTARKPGPHWP